VNRLSDFWRSIIGWRRPERETAVSKEDTVRIGLRLQILKFYFGNSAEFSRIDLDKTHPTGGPDYLDFIHGGGGGWRFNEDVSALMKFARQVAESEFEVFVVRYGRPMHVTMKPTSSAKPAIVFHSALTGHVGLINRIMWLILTRTDRSFPFAGTSPAKEMERVCLRLFADHLLYRGRMKSAIACLAAARKDDFQGHLNQAHLIGSSGQVSLIEAVKGAELHLPVVFHGFAHELGHHVNAATMQTLDTLLFLDLNGLSQRITEYVKDLRGDNRVPHPSEGLSETDKRLMATAFEEILSSVDARAKNLRNELIPDLIAIRILWAACVKRSWEWDRTKPELYLFMTQILVSQIALVATEAISHSRAIVLPGQKLSSKLISENLRSVIETSLRLYVIADAFDLAHQFLGLPRLDRAEYQSWIANTARPVAELAGQFLSAANAAEDKVPTEEKVKIDNIRDFLASPEQAMMTMSDTWMFWDLVDGLKLNCAEVEDMPEVKEIRSKRADFKSHMAKTLALD
jgi:hypothetical protein